jgi:hypothetical protein
MTIDRHTLAVINIVGSAFDVLGGLYLAYDLLGGEHGPLRTLTRGVTYGVLFGAGYGVALGPVFGLTSGAAHGLTLAWEFSRAAQQKPKPGFWYDTAMSAIRGFGYALGASYLYGPAFGITFGALSTVGQVIAYQFGIRPGLDYSQAKRPHITTRQFLSAINRTVGYGITGYISALMGRQPERALSFGLEVGLMVGIVTALSLTFAPFIEWTADHVPARRMGVVGIGMILIGFALQSVQYWLTLLDVGVR